jgi:signal transduction histidine kinase
MRFRTWPVAAVGLGCLLALILLSMLTLSRKAQLIYSEIDQLNTHHHDVDARLRRLRSDVNLSGIFVRDYLLDVAREHATDYRERLATFRRDNIQTVKDLRVIDAAHAERIDNLQLQLDGYWQTFEPLFDWTATEKIFRSATFLRNEVVPRREAILAIAQEIEELNNANLAAQRAEVTNREASFREDLWRLLGRTILLGIVVALVAVYRLRLLERRSEQQRTIAEEAENKMRELSQRLVALQEDERRNLSRELHDHVGQMLTALRMEIGRVDRSKTSADSSDAVAECRRLIDQMFRTVRDLALGLRPSMLDDFGLQPALEWLVRDVTNRYGVDVTLKVVGDLDALPDRHRTCVYRSVQEALTNCMRHSGASKIEVVVIGSEGRIRVTVKDDGVGLDPRRRRDGLGLRGIEERVKELKGTFAISGTLNRGTTIDLDLPAPALIQEDALARSAG